MKNKTTFYYKSGYNNKPSIYTYRKNGLTNFMRFYVGWGLHSIGNPSGIFFKNNGKIRGKEYHINGCYYNKIIEWKNQIKNI